VTPPAETDAPVRSPRGRYAPSPTGEVHLGNAFSGLLAWLSIRSRGGSFVMRVEDLDRNRVRPGLAERILDDLAWLGLDWDEGPDRGGPFAPYEQWARRERYTVALDRLRAAGRVYPCFCSRKDIAAAASAPQAAGDELRYPGTCRRLDPQQARRRLEDAERHAWRFRVEPGERSRFVDLVRGGWGADQTEATGDFVVSRADDSPAYQLAVVVDDAEMEIDEVVRGDDLLLSTARQLLLYDALGWEPPVFGHVPLLLGPDGIRMSKRHAGITLRELRDSGLDPARIVGRLVWLAGLVEHPRPVAAADLVDGFSLDRVRPAPLGIRVDISDWK
jgi:glutamyl-tRNA synthetase